MPGKRVKVYFKQPNQTKLESKGFAVIPKNGLMENPVNLLDDLSELTVIGEGIENDRKHWILSGTLSQDSIQFKPWGNSGLGHLQLQIWVDQEYWTIGQTKTFVDSSQVLLIRSEYIEVEKDIFLPKKTLIRFEIDQSILNTLEDFSNFNHSEPQSPAGDIPEKMAAAKGTITLKFDDYILNQGLPDELFIDAQSDG
jgi:hypothetical protein